MESKIQRRRASLKMEYRDKFKIALTVASLAALAIFFTNRRRRKQKCNRNRCYLRDEPMPQFNFKRVYADNSYSQFKHLKLDSSQNDCKSNSHPYEAEITSLLENPQLEFTFKSENADLKMIETYTWVETESQLEKLADMLGKESSIAVDTEQHSLRSYLGFTALIQISSPKEDYLVDTIALHDSMCLLRPVFANGNICKVFHGADNDVLWLQRDFHIYIVNLFDTAKACEVLSKPQKSLACLLETYCGVDTNKLLQREDWRQRPLPLEMVEYAQTDAHYLLYIANCLLAELKQRDIENSCSDDKFHFVHEASQRSNMVCLQVYTKEIEASPGESAASSISSRHLNGHRSSSLVSCQTQFISIVRRLCAWRDLMARVHDESLRYVLSDQAIASLADHAPLTAAEIVGTIAKADQSVDLSCSVLPSPSPVVSSHLDDFYYLLRHKTDDHDNIFMDILQKCLGSKGSCPLSIFNYALLLNYSKKMQLPSKHYGIKNVRRIAKRNSRELFVQKFSCKSPVYHNCRIYANDGRLLCYCDRRKLEWYIHRDLAELVKEDPPAIRLLFEPKGRPEDEGNDFYIQSKRNICVGCGEGNHYLRYRIIPSCYRMHFPEILKSHRSHDIVLLCVDCHEVAHAAAEKYKKTVAAEFGIPLFVSKVFDPRETKALSGLSYLGSTTKEAGVSPLQLRTAAMALLRHGPKMPAERREELTQIVMRYYGGKEISEKDLEEALLVGMSPHERRRLEKKRGITLKHSIPSILPDSEQKRNTYIIDSSAKLDLVSSAVIPSDVHVTNSPFGRNGEVIGEDEYDNSSFHSYSGPDGEAAAINKCIDSTDNIDSGQDACSVKVEDSCKSENLLLNGSDASEQPKLSSKLSLLGHGPHGKQVVDQILKDYGDDGIRQFCQRWRQVFVEAVHPRFLPSGWDVNHSGRRDFGEFSVYNPAKKNTSGSNDL